MRGSAAGIARVVLSLLLVLGAAAAPAGAWTSATRTRILEDATRLMPATLRDLLRAHRRDLVAGMLDAVAAEDHPDHWQHPEGAYGSAATRAEAEARGLAAAVDGHRGFREIARRFGILAHYVADINHPLHTADRHAELRVYYADYDRYLEAQSPRFRLVFLGYRAATLEREGPRAFLMESAARARDYAVHIRRSYGPDGSRVSPQAFDERSLAFGVGSLSYSHAVNDVARVWLWAWEECHGDTSRTPFPLPPAEESSP